MHLENHHRRHLAATPTQVGSLLDTLSSPGDRLWPRPWPPMRFNGPLAVGADGGHGPIRYRVVRYEPGVRVAFAIHRPFTGEHGLEVVAHADGAVLHHWLFGEAVGRDALGWRLAFRWLHDALIEDGFDRAERELTGTVRRPAQWSPAVRLLRARLSS